MAERQNERFGALEVENSTEDIEDTESEMESQSESEEERLKELPPLKQSRLGEVLRSSCGNAVAESRNEAKTPTAASSAHLSRDNQSDGLPGHSTQREESKELDVISQQDVMAGTTVSNVTNACVAVAHLQSCSINKLSLSPSALKASGTDGYNWRKYGQKQVKSPQGSRSYFRCTYSECCAKKIEFSDHVGHLRETIYKSQHNHDPPRKVNSVKQSRIMKTAGPLKESNAAEYPIPVLKDSNPSTTARESVQDLSTVPKGIPQDSTGFYEDAKTTSKGEDALESEPKDRGRKKASSHSSPVLQPGKKPKLVIHAASDVGISGDGYRWRKYGQKMVKGKPHPRNYYRCTSAGCPARKHIETAADNASVVIITYKGIHNHGMPVPKKRHGLPSPLLVAAASPASLSSSQGKKPDPSQTQKSPSQWPVNVERDLTRDALELGGEKAMESARTLLSIGIEIKPC